VWRVACGVWRVGVGDSLVKFMYMKIVNIYIYIYIYCDHVGAGDSLVAFSHAHQLGYVLLASYLSIQCIHKYC